METTTVSFTALQVFFIVFGLFFGAYIATIMTRYVLGATNPKVYKRTYRELPNLKFVRNGNQVYDSNDNGFIWFTDTNHFKLFGHKIYLHNDPTAILFNPYGEWWRRKYVKWFEENVDVETLPNYSKHIIEKCIKNN